MGNEVPSNALISAALLVQAKNHVAPCLAAHECVFTRNTDRLVSGISARGLMTAADPIRRTIIDLSNNLICLCGTENVIFLVGSLNQHCRFSLCKTGGGRNTEKTGVGYPMFEH